MKPTQSTQHPSPDPGGRRSAFTPLTSESITDVMIRYLQRNARREGDAEMCVCCAKALRSPVTIRTLGDATARHAARRACAQHINSHVTSWLERPTLADRPYAELVGLVDSTTPLTGPDPTGTAQVLNQCWACNDPFGTSHDPENEHPTVVRTRTGRVTVHRGCVAWLVLSGEVDAATIANLDDYDYDFDKAGNRVRAALLTRAGTVKRRATTTTDRARSQRRHVQSRRARR